jgi:hypothetical protein
MGLPALVGAGIAMSAISTGMSFAQSSAARKQQAKQQRKSDAAAAEARRKDRASTEDRNRALRRQRAGRGKATILGGESQTEIGRSVLLGQ